MVSNNGTTKMSNMLPDITVTANARRRKRAWTLSINGQVATTIIAAQTIERRNGRRIQNEAAISTAISSTESTVRVRSRRVAGVGAVSVIACPSPVGAIPGGHAHNPEEQAVGQRLSGH